MVDARDLKSLEGNLVWVRVPPSAPDKMKSMRPEFEQSLPPEFDLLFKYPQDVTAAIKDATIFVREAIMVENAVRTDLLPIEDAIKKFLEEATLMDQDSTNTIAEIKKYLHKELESFWKIFTSLVSPETEITYSGKQVKDVIGIDLSTYKLPIIVYFQPELGPEGAIITLQEIDALRQAKMTQAYQLISTYQNKVLSSPNYEMGDEEKVDVILTYQIQITLSTYGQVSPYPLLQEDISND